MPRWDWIVRNRNGGRGRKTNVGLAVVLAGFLTSGALAAGGAGSIDERFAAAGAALKAAVASGQMSEPEAWAAWHARRLEIVQAAVAEGTLDAEKGQAWQREIQKERLGGQLKAAGERVKAAAQRGEISGDEAWEQWYAARDKLIDGAVAEGRISADDAVAVRQDVYKAELSERLEGEGARIKWAAMRGELTEAQAWMEWYSAKERLINEAVALGEITEGDAEEFRVEIRKGELKERINNAGEELKATVLRGDMSEDEAWAAWAVIREELIAEALAAGDVAAEEAAALARGYEQWAVGQQLKNAVARGDMTEAEARAAWEQYEQQIEREQAAGKAGEPDDAWARYVRGFIKRYDLDQGQQRRAWRFYERSRAEAVQRARRLADVPRDGTVPATEKRAEAAAERLERDRERLFERLKGQLERLPTAAQRRAVTAN
jgi:polyhydroxyalkanoate synthesis regulator phasin